MPKKDVIIKEVEPEVELEVEPEEVEPEEVEPTEFERVLAHVDTLFGTILTSLDALSEAIAGIADVSASVAIDNGAEVRTVDADGDGDIDAVIEVPEVEDLDLDI